MLARKLWIVVPHHHYCQSLDCDQPQSRICISAVTRVQVQHIRRQMQPPLHRRLHYGELKLKR